MMSFPFDVAIISKSASQKFRVRIVRPAGVPLVRLELLERDRFGEFRTRPGVPGVPAQFAGAIAAAFSEADRLIGGAA